MPQPFGPQFSKLHSRPLTVLVLGLILPDLLVKTLPFGFNKFYIEPPKNIKEFLEREITLNNISFIRHYLCLSLIHGCENMGAAGVWVVLSNGIFGTLMSVDAMKDVTRRTVGAATLSSSVRNRIAKLPHFFILPILGLISPEELGRTLTHEHFSIGYQKLYIAPPEQLKPFFEKKISLENIGFIRQYPYSCRYNVQFDDEESHAAVLYDMELYKKFGGGAVVENTPHGLQRNMQFMKEVSQKTGVHIISGTGYYLASVQPSSVLAQTQEILYNLMLMELTTRCMEQHDVKCGFIGEVASGWPLHDFEKRAIQAAGEVQAQVGCPVSFHSGRSPEAPFEIIRLFQESGGNAHKAVMSHLERTFYEEEDILEFSSLSTYCQFDLFGNECSYYQVNPTADMPSDAQRIDKILCLLSEGKEENILVSHDIHTKHRLIKFGGHGYSHILNNVLPKMLVKGISQAEINKIIIKNPKSWLSYKCLLFKITVLGLISPEELGRTLTHEHFSIDYQKLYIAPPEQLKPFFEKKISLENIGFIRQYPYSNKYNCQFNDTETHAAVLYDMMLFKQFGGGAVVENSNHGLQRNVQFLKEVSQKTGIHVIAGTGHYISLVQPPSVLAQSKESMYNLIMSELTTGCIDQPDIKCGFIGEVGSGWPLHEFERRAIIATGEVQSQLGCPVSFHPGRHPEAPFEIIRLYQEAGGDVKKAVMSHLDRTLVKDEDLLEFSNLGCYCQFDLFGTECSLYQMNLAVDMPSDAQRMDKVMCLVDAGKEDRILMSHDVHTKHRLIQFGGHGYSHIFNNIIPKMLTKGISQATINKITIDNPKTWLTYKVEHK